MHSSILLLGAGAAAGALAASLPRALPPCDPAVIALATGIHLNIQGQYAEYNATVAVETLETQSPLDLVDILIAKGKLESVIQSGQNIRLFNQQILPVGNPATAGLAKYAAAEETEKALAAGLKGLYALDKDALDSLKSDILQGIQLNESNLKNATSLCDFTLVFPPANEEGV